MTLKLLFVGEGERDRAAVPRLVECLLGTAVEPGFERWARLHHQGARRGLGRKLQFAVRQALDRGADGLVATVDSDRATHSDKIHDLERARVKDRERGVHVPTVVGEAIPHLEAWLLDDPGAVRSVLKLEANREIPSPTKVKSPKEALEQLCNESGCTGSIADMLGSIARHIARQRCIHADRTGFGRLCNEVEGELRPLVPSGATGRPPR